MESGQPACLERSRHPSASAALHGVIRQFGLGFSIFCGGPGMFGWARQKRSSIQQKQSRVTILRDTLSLVRVANEVESESDGNLTSTTPRDLARSRMVRNAQRVLTEHVLRGLQKGLSWDDITREVIAPVLEESAVGDVARFAIEEALRGVERTFSSR